MHDIYAVYFIGMYNYICPHILKRFGKLHISLITEFTSSGEVRGVLRSDKVANDTAVSLRLNF
jgi:hypothetical protein